MKKKTKARKASPKNNQKNLIAKRRASDPFERVMLLPDMLNEQNRNASMYQEKSAA